MDEDEYRKNMKSLQSKNLKNIFLLKYYYDANERGLHTGKQPSKHNHRLKYTRSSKEQKTYDQETWNDEKKFNSKSTNTDFARNIRSLHTSTASTNDRSVKLHRKSMELLDFQNSAINMNVQPIMITKKTGSFNSAEKWSSQLHGTCHDKHQDQQRLRSATSSSSKKTRQLHFSFQEPKPILPSSSNGLLAMNFDKFARTATHDNLSRSTMYDNSPRAAINETPHAYTQMNEDHRSTNNASKSNSEYQLSSTDGADSPDLYAKVGKPSSVNVYSNLAAKLNPINLKRNHKKGKSTGGLSVAPKPTTNEQQNQKPFDSPTLRRMSSLSAIAKNPPAATDTRPPTLDDINKRDVGSPKRNDIFKYIIKQKTTLKSFLSSQLSRSSKAQADSKTIKRILSDDCNDQKIRHFSNCVITDLKIGEGEFGETFQGFRYDIGNDAVKIAAKRLKLSHKKRKDHKCNNNTKVLDEVRVLSALGKHDNVVEFLGINIMNDTIYMLFEYAEKGCLKMLLDNARIDPKTSEISVNSLWKLKFAYEIACGMDYVSAIGIVHRDLAARNVLLSHEFSCKISDFGFMKADFMTKCPIRWMAPECITKAQFTTESDVWAFGIVS